MAENLPAKTESALPAIPQASELRDIMAENCEGLSPQFEAITVPAGGGLSFTMLNDNGEPQPVVEIQAVIIDHYPARAYWSKSMASGTKAPPDCSSNDALRGTVYGSCLDCQFSKFGTEIKDNGSQGRGQACKKMHRVFFMQVGQESIFPKMLVLPPTSAESKYEGSITTYAQKLTGRLKRLSGVITKIKLSTEKNAEGISYSRVMFFYGSDLSKEDTAKIGAIRDALKGAMRQKPIDEPSSTQHASQNEPQASVNNDPWETGA